MLAGPGGAQVLAGPGGAQVLAGPGGAAGSDAPLTRTMPLHSPCLQTPRGVGRERGGVAIGIAEGSWKRDNPFAIMIAV